VNGLVIRPKFDEVTEYSYRWGDDPVNLLKQANYGVVDLRGRPVTKAEVKQAIERDDPEIVVHYDHGEEDGWLGSPTERVMTSADAQLLSGRVVYTMNCLSAKKLGVEAWKNKAKVYVGYIDVFAFTTDEEDLFRGAAVHGLELFLREGVSDWKQIKERMVQKYDEMIKAAKGIWSQIWLTHDRDALRVYNGETPETECPFRKLAIMLLGEKLGWKLRFSLSFIFDRSILQVR
jgi:hypothetical protein